VKKALGRISPWVIGLIDGISASNLIRSSVIEHKNRIAFIILDSTLEQVFKKYITNVKKIQNVQDSKKWESREFLEKLVRGKTDFEEQTWDDVTFFYKIRTGLYHEESEKTVTDAVVGRFQELVEFFINELFQVKCTELVPQTPSLLPKENETEKTDKHSIPINTIREKVNVILVAVAESQSKSTTELRDFLRKKGLKEMISPSILGGYLNKYVHLFYFDEYWKLTEEGHLKYENISKSYVQDKLQDQNVQGK
jgi:hypothetical protein